MGSYLRAGPYSEIVAYLKNILFHTPIYKWEKLYA